MPELNVPEAIKGTLKFAPWQNGEPLIEGAAIVLVLVGVQTIVIPDILASLGVIVVAVLPFVKVNVLMKLCVFAGGLGLP